MGEKHIASQCPENKRQCDQDKEELFLIRGTVKEIHNYNPDTVKCMEKNDTPQANLKILKKRGIKCAHYRIKFFRPFGQCVNNPDMGREIKN